jgi:hypothetical protein
MGANPFVNNGYRGTFPFMICFCSETGHIAGIYGTVPLSDQNPLYFPFYCFADSKSIKKTGFCLKNSAIFCKKSTESSQKG